MKKMAMMAGAVFVVATAAGAGAKIMMTPPPEPPAEEEHADADHEDGHHEDAASGDHHGSADDSHGEKAADDAHHQPGSGDSSPHPADKGKSAPTKNPTTGVEFKEMARILTQLPALEAGFFLRHLEDEDVVTVLGSMPVRDAAKILDGFPRERAENLKKSLFKKYAEAK